MENKFFEFFIYTVLGGLGIWVSWVSKVLITIQVQNSIIFQRIGLRKKDLEHNNNLYGSNKNE